MERASSRLAGVVAGLVLAVTLASPLPALAEGAVSDQSPATSGDTPVVDVANAGDGEYVKQPVGEYGDVPAEGDNGGKTDLWVKGPDEEEKSDAAKDKDTDTPGEQGKSLPGTTSLANSGNVSGSLAKTADYLLSLFPIMALLVGEIFFYVSLSDKNAVDVESEGLS